MKLTLKQIDDINNLLSSLSNTNFKSKVAYKISKTLKLIQNSVSTLEETRRNLVIKYGEKDPETGNCNVKEENKVEFFREYGELCNIEEELDLPQINFEELDGVELTPKFFIIMGDIITG